MSTLAQIMGGIGSYVSVIRIVGSTFISNIDSGFGCIAVVVAIVDINLLVLFMMMTIPLLIV